jgi:hypothetical protein
VQTQEDRLIAEVNRLKKDLAEARSGGVVAKRAPDRYGSPPCIVDLSRPEPKETNGAMGVPKRNLFLGKKKGKKRREDSEGGSYCSDNEGDSEGEEVEDDLSIVGDYFDGESDVWEDEVGEEEVEYVRMDTLKSRGHREEDECSIQSVAPSAKESGYGVEPEDVKLARKQRLRAAHFDYPIEGVPPEMKKLTLMLESAEGLRWYGPLGDEHRIVQVQHGKVREEVCKIVSGPTQRRIKTDLNLTDALKYFRPRSVWELPLFFKEI